MVPGGSVVLWFSGSVWCFVNTVREGMGEEFSIVRLVFQKQHLNKAYKMMNNSPQFVQLILPIAQSDRANFSVFKYAQSLQDFEKWPRYLKKTVFFAIFVVFF